MSVKAADVRARIDSEGRVPFSQASRERGVHTATMHRWHLNGVRGPGGVIVRLEAYRAGGKFVTSRAAVERFLDEINSSAEESSPPRSPTARAKASARAAAELETMGV